jgi:acylphosphatase
MMDSAAFQAIVQGRVQGVFYRDFTARNAVRLGLTGYVHNLPGGSVEIHAEGARKQLETLAELLKQGPPNARVDNLAVTWSEHTGRYHDFSVKR